MTRKQERFVEEYLIDINATQAAKRAGYSAHTARYIGGELLQKNEIREAIRKRMDEIHEKKIADAKEVLEYLTSVMRGLSTTEIPLVVACGDGTQEIKMVEKTPDEKDRLKAAELIGKRYQMFSERFAVDGVVPVVFYGADQLEE